MLRTRILSSLVILPPVLAAVWWGGYAFLVLLALIGAAMVWELYGFSGASSRLGAIAAGALGASTPFGAFYLGLGYDAFWIAGAGVVFMALIFKAPNLDRARLGFAISIVLILLALSLLVWLRGGGVDGRITVFWLVVTIAGTDIGGYFAGRAVGGPKLAPSISPNKTWAGLVGGTILAGTAGFLFATFVGSPAVVPITLTSAAIAPVAQCGDLFESWIKRQLDAKDSSRLIPGHGGVLDRADGYLTAVPMVTLIALMHEGSLLTWP